MIKNKSSAIILGLAMLALYGCVSTPAWQHPSVPLAAQVGFLYGFNDFTDLAIQLGGEYAEDNKVIELDSSLFVFGEYSPGIEVGGQNGMFHQISVGVRF